MAKICYYETLEVERTVDEAGLKSAFRKLAMKWHPDKNPGDQASEVRFKEINEAYEVLKDPQKRAAYDRFGHAAFEQGMGGGGAGFGNDFGTTFSDIFEGIFGMASGRRAPRPRPRRRDGCGCRPRRRPEYSPTACARASPGPSRSRRRTGPRSSGRGHDRSGRCARR